MASGLKFLAIGVVETRNNYIIPYIAKTVNRTSRRPHGLMDKTSVAITEGLGSNPSRVEVNFCNYN